MSDDFLFEYRIKHTFHGILDILDSLVDYVIQSYINTLCFSRSLGCCIGADIKPYDDRI